MSFLQGRSLRSSVTLFTLSLFLLSLWSLTLYASRMLRADIETLTSEQQYSTVSLVAASINADLQDRVQALTLVAAGIDESMLKNPPALQKHIEQSVLLHPLFNAGVHVVGADGVGLVDVSKVPGRAGTDFSVNADLRAALSQGTPRVGAPLMGPLLKQPVFPIVAPIFDRQAKVIGAIAGTTNLGTPNFLDRLGQGHYGLTGGYVLLAPQQRLIVTATDRSRVLQSLPASKLSPLFERLLQGQEGSGVALDPQDVEVLVSAQRLPAAGWTLLAALPTAEAFAPIQAMQRRMLLAAALLTLLTAILTHWLLRRQLAPLTLAAKTLSAISDTDRATPPLEVTRHDEIGQLLTAFNRLMSRIGQREAMFKQILNTASVAIFLVDNLGRITQANERMAQMFGFSVDALNGLEYVTLVDPQERDAARKMMLNLLASTIPAVDLDRHYWRADHSRFWGHLSGRRFFGADGQQQGLVGVIADITDRKRVEEKLQQHGNMLSAVIENLPGGISMIDNDLHLTAYNKQLKKLLDFPDALFEKPDLGLADIFRFNAERGEYGPGDIAQQVTDRVERARNFQPHKFERVRPDGTVIEIQGEPLPGGGFVTIYLDITERKQMEAQVRQLAFYDPLTQLPNRRLLMDRLSQSIAASKRSGCYGALMFLDLDNFKALNDTHGHGAGDLLLIEAAHRLKICVREIDTVGRLGGDEFVVVVGDLNADKAESSAQAKIIAEKISAALAEPYRLVIGQGGAMATSIEHRCSASIGVVVFIDSEGTQEDFLKWADAAMYRAKEAGPGLISFS